MGGGGGGGGGGGRVVPSSPASKAERDEPPAALALPGGGGGWGGGGGGGDLAGEALAPLPPPNKPVKPARILSRMLSADTVPLAAVAVPLLPLAVLAGAGGLLLSCSSRRRRRALASAALSVRWASSLSTSPAGASPCRTGSSRAPSLCPPLLAMGVSLDSSTSA